MIKRLTASTKVIDVFSRILKTKIPVSMLALMILSIFSGTVSAQMGGGVGSQICESCGMTVDSVSQAHLKVVDSTGTIHYVDCLKCALKLVPKYDSLNITATCDWYGPTNSINIVLKDHEDTVTVSPQSALFIDGTCTKNRVLSNQTAVDAIFANNGRSPYLAALQNVTIASNATVMSVVQAARTYAFTDSPLPSVTPTTSPSPTPSPSPAPSSTATVYPSTTPTSTPKPVTPNPTPTANPTAITPAPTAFTTKTCEACGMDVTAETQAKYTIVDGTGQAHYAECIMCALQLVNRYDQLTISTYCDWYGPNYTITLQSSNFGKDVTVMPSTAMFLNGGSCVINRAAYNQTAADQLLINGYSTYTVSEQRYSLPTDTKVSLMATAAMSYAQTIAQPLSNLPVILAAAAGIAIIVVSILAFKKLNQKRN